MPPDGWLAQSSSFYWSRWTTLSAALLLATLQMREASIGGPPTTKHSLWLFATGLKRESS